MQRKLAAILAADVVGYSRLIRADEAGTLALMKTLWREIVKPTIREHRGRVFKLMGDGLLAEFPSVVDAAAAATAIQTEVNERAVAEPEPRRIQLRIGINLGDVVVDGSDLYGDGINLAARLQEIAEPGGVAVSASTYENLRGKTNTVFTDAGERQLKNIAEPVRIWLWHSAATLAASANPIASRSSQPSIAVLPFQNLSAHPDAEFFADGMTEDVINALSKFRWLFVIARGTMFTYKGKTTATSQVAAELGVRYVLEGSVRQAGQRIRLSAQVLDTETRNHLWSERFDRQLDDIFSIQDEITNAIAAAIAPEIDRAERRRVDKSQRTEVNAWLLYQEGLAAYYRLTEPELEKAITIFVQAQEADAQFAPAISMEAVARARMAQNFRIQDLGEPMLAVLELAAKAIALDPRDPLAWWASGRVHSVMGAHEEAIKHTERAISLNPNYAMAWFGLANALGRFDPSEHALSAVDKAIALSPFDPFLPVFLHVRGILLYKLNRLEDAIDDLEQAIHLGGVAVWCYLVRVLAYWDLGKKDSARRAAEELLQEHPNFTIDTFIQAGLPITKHKQDFTAILQELGVPEA